MIPKIYRRGRQTWSIRFDLPPNSEGKRQQRRVAVHGTRRDAEREAADIASKLARDGYLDTRFVRFDSVLDDWIQDAQRRVKPRTLERYKSTVRLYLQPAFGGHKLTQLTPGAISDALDSWVAGERKDGRTGKLSDTTIHHTFRTLVAVLNFAVRRSLIVKNNALLVSAPRRSTVERHSITPQQLRQLLEATDDETTQIAILAAIGLGVRCGEIVALQWRDIDFATGIVSIKRGAINLKGRTYYQGPKNRSSVRALAAPAFVLRALELRRRSQNAFYEAVALEQSSATFVFDTFGVPINPSNLSSRFYRLKKRAGLLGCRLHDLRHSFATLLLSAGTELKVISAALGHSTIVTTANVYAHVLPQLRQAAAERLDSIFEAALTSTPDQFQPDKSVNLT